MHPGKKIAHEALGEAFRLVQALEQQAAEDSHDRGGIKGRQRQQLPFRSENTIEASA